MPLASQRTPTVLLPLLRTGRRLARHLEPRLAARGLSTLEAEILLALAESPPLTPGELRRRFAHQASTLTGLLDRLVDKELVERTLHPDDRRSFLIAATVAGVARAREVRWDLVKVEEQLRARFSAAELAAFERGLDAIRELTDPEP